MSRILADLAARAAKPARMVVGLMSGTSADSIDVALCRFEGEPPRVTLVHYAEFPNRDDLRALVARAGQLETREVAELNVLVAERFAEACLAMLELARVDVAEIDVIGSHGQTIYHHGGVAGALRATLQLGDGDTLAERTGLPVVSDFRARDIAAGGEGAPLSPIADAVLFGVSEGSTHVRRAVLNLGGIANLTILDKDPSQIRGWDTGPANAPLDRLARVLTGTACDIDGRIARSGHMNIRLLDRLVAEDTFLSRRPPKSTGFEVYGDAFLHQAGDWHGGYDEHLMATLVEFSARAIAESLRRDAGFDRPGDELIVAGGGARNPVLLARIAALIAPVTLRPSDEVGIPSDAREAMAFAVLADMTLRGQPAFLPPVTGARGPRVLGKLSFPT